jgi:hypothetical protein
VVGLPVAALSLGQDVPIHDGELEIKAAPASANQSRRQRGQPGGGVRSAIL